MYPFYTVGRTAQQHRIVVRGEREREKKVHNCESVNCIWPLGGRSKSKSEPQPLVSNHVDKNHKKNVSPNDWSLELRQTFIQPEFVMSATNDVTAVITFHFLNREINDHKTPS